ncbi:MAG: hypothetical protein Q8N13_10940 [Acidovorax sp.]|nr:hypothetical protein [Acidovorax sp.]
MSAARPTVPWDLAQSICDVPDVNEAIRCLIEDNTGDNATCMVRAVADAVVAKTCTGEATGEVKTLWTPVPAVLHPETALLVVRFATALAAKLAAAQAKYGYSNGWAASDWLDECRRQLVDHVDKGDPLDVAAYCAFLFHHQASTYSRAWNPMSTAPRDGSIIRLLVEFEEHQLEDHEGPQHTIGRNSFDNTGVDAWQFVGWCWTHHHYTEGKGTVVGWLPFSPTAL